MTTETTDPRIAEALAGKPFLEDRSKWSEAEWESAIAYAREGGDLSELEWMFAEDDRIQAELDDEDRRLGCSYADYLYDNRRAAESYVPAGGVA